MSEMRISGSRAGTVDGYLDLDALLQPLSDESPCGDDLEYDSELGALELAAQGRPEQEIGSTLVPAQGPEWGEVVADALAIMQRTKDLRVCVYLTQGLLNTAGTAGLAQSLALTRRMIERFWDCIHPQLDPEEDNDPTMRVNILGGLCHPDFMLGAFRRAPLVVSASIGRFSLRDIAVAAGELAPEEGERPAEESTIEAAWRSAEPQSLIACDEDLQRALDELQGIDTALDERLPSGGAPDFSPLRSQLRAAKRLFDQRLVNSGAVVEESFSPAAGMVGEEAAEQTVPRVAFSGDIAGRDDVVEALDKICDYYARNEPSSPVPLLMRRAKRLVNMDFMALIQDLAPDGLTQIQSIRGPEAEEDTDD